MKPGLPVSPAKRLNSNLQTKIIPMGGPDSRGRDWAEDNIKIFLSDPKRGKPSNNLLLLRFEFGHSCKAVSFLVFFEVNEKLKVCDQHADRLSIAANAKSSEASVSPRRHIFELSLERPTS